MIDFELLEELKKYNKGDLEDELEFLRKHIKCYSKDSSGYKKIVIRGRTIKEFLKNEKNT